MTVPVIYIAGPFRAPTAWGIAENVRAAERVGLEVARAGGMPLIPHANTAHFHGEGADELWLEGTLELLRRCDAMVLVDGYERSSGTKAEIKEAERLGIPILFPREWSNGTELRDLLLLEFIHRARAAAGRARLGR